MLISATLWQRFGGASGLVFICLVFGFVLWAPLNISVREPPFDGPGKDWLAYAQATHASAGMSASVAVMMAIVLSFMLFGAVLSIKVRGAGQGQSVPSTLVLLTTGLTAGLWAIGFAGNLTIYFRGAELDASSAGLIYGYNNSVFVVSWFAIGGLLLAAGVGGLSEGTLRPWLSVSAMIIGFGFFVGGAMPLAGFWFLPYALFFLWVGVVSFVMLLGAAIEPAPKSDSNEAAVRS